MDKHHCLDLPSEWKSSLEDLEPHFEVVDTVQDLQEVHEHLAQVWGQKGDSTSAITLTSKEMDLAEEENADVSPETL